MASKSRSLVKAVLVLILATAGAVLAGQEVKTGAVDPKQIEAPVADAKQIKVSDDLKKPAWLTELSVTTREVYDSNVFGTDVNRTAAFPKIANVSSWMTAVTPKVAVNFAPLLGADKDDKSVETLALSYAPEVVRYYDAATENYEAHRVGTQIKGKLDSFSYNLDSAFVYIDGNENSPQYSTASAYGTAIARERRDQMQERGKLVLRNDWEAWFVRGVANTTYYDLNTKTYDNSATSAHPGWQNWVDRYDVNGGIDIGYKITKDFAATLGYRYGHQYQQNFNWSAGAPSNTNDYNRVLGGFEGKPVKWLKVEVQGGPSFHSYDQNLAQPGHDNDITQFFCEGTAVAEITSVDSLALTVKQWQWVSSTGVSSYEDKTYGAVYKRKWLKEFSTTAGILIQNSNYDAPTIRTDWLYTYSFGAKYDLNEYLSFMADYSYSRGENGVDESTANGREFERNLVTLGVKAQF